MADDFARQLLDALYNPETQPPQQPSRPLREKLIGAAETAGTLGSGLLASVPAGLAGMAQLIPTRGRAPTVNRAAQKVEDVQSALTYMPRTEAGQEYLEKTAGALGVLGMPAEFLGEQTLKLTGSPFLATAANVGLDPVNYIGVPGSGKAAVATTKALGRAAAAAPRIAGEMAQDLLMGRGRMEGQRGAIKLAGKKQEKSIYPQAEALERARKNAVEMLGLPENNTPEMRAQAMGYIDYLHGTERMDRLLEGKTLDPRRATSGPMPYGTTTPELASSYATSKADTSRRAADEGDIRRYFEVSPKDIGLKGLRSPIPVEMAWHFMSPEQKAKIRELAPRVGYENLDEFTGKLMVHPEGVNATLSPNQWDWLMKNEAKGNPLTALRHMWYESGQLVDEPEMLGQIYKLAGVNAPISQTKAPWTEAQGVLLGKARITNPIDTSNTEQVSALIEPLKQAFAKDRSKTKAGGPDQWAKESRYTPKTWVSELEKDLAEGKESYVWTSIPDKVTAELKKLGFNGIIDRSGKGGGAKEPVVIPFDPAQVRSRFAAFDPAEMDKPDLLKKTGGEVHVSDSPDTMRLELAAGGGVGEERDWRSKIAGGGIRGIITRGFLGMDAPEDMTPTEREVYENAVRASAPAQGLGVGKAIFIGSAAKTWNKAAAARAVELEKAGVKPEQIWRETGTFRGADGKLRQEISDVGAVHRNPKELQELGKAKKEEAKELQSRIAGIPGQKDLFPKALTEAKRPVREQIKQLKEEADQLMRPSDTRGQSARFALEHPELYKAYPELGDIPVFQGGLGLGRELGSLRGAAGDLEMSVTQAGLRQGPKSTMLHEMQHAVQSLEGMSPGGSPTMAFQDPMAFEILNQLRKEAYKPPSFEEFQRVNKYPESEAQNAYAQFLKEREANPIVNPAIERSLQERAAMEYYKRLAGEAEARATQFREGMGPTQRRQEFPYSSYDVLPDDLIVKNPRDNMFKKRGGSVKITDNLDTMRLAVQKRK